MDFLDSKHDEVLMCRSLLDHLNSYLLIPLYLTTVPFSCSYLPGYSSEFITWGQFLSCFILILSSWLRQPVEVGSFWCWQEVWGHGGVCGQPPVLTTRIRYALSSKANGNERKVPLSLGYCIIAPHWSRSHINCTCFIIAWIKREIGTLKIKSRCWRALLAQLV